jgi:hypothetical protein
MHREASWLRDPAAGSENRLATYAYAVAVVLTIGVGMYFRTVGVFTDRFSFWLDEAVWAQLVTQTDWYRHAIRPLGYLATSRLLVHLYDTELPLRMLAYVPGMLSLVLFLLVLRASFSSRPLLVAGLLIVATHPALIEYSREYKPYALSVCVHLALVLSTLRYIQVPSSGRLALAAGLACVSPLWAVDAVFALPAVFALLFARAYRDRAWRHMHALGVLVIVALTITISLYAFIWHTEAGIARAYWGHKYGVFHFAGESEPTPSAWLWDKTRSLVLQATMADQNFAIPLEPMVLLGAFFAAVPLALWRRESLAILLAVPIGAALVFHLAGLWPWGPFRANQFLVIYIVPLTLLSFDLLGRGSRDPFVSMGVAAVALLLIAAHFPTDLAAYEGKRFPGHSSLREALEVVREHHLRSPDATRKLAGRVPLVADRHAGPAISYYTQQHAYLRDRFAFIREEFEVIYTTGWNIDMWTDPRIPIGRPMWVITENPENTITTKRFLTQYCAVEMMVDLPGDDLVAYARCP